MSGRIKSALESILKKFASGEIPEVVSLSLLPYKSKPSFKWSLLNRALMIAGGTLDARGYNQWKAVNRFVKKDFVQSGLHYNYPYQEKNRPLLPTPPKEEYPYP